MVRHEFASPVRSKRGGSAHSVTARTEDVVRGGTDVVSALQRSAGNRATAQLLKGSPANRAVQRSPISVSSPDTGETVHEPDTSTGMFAPKAIAGGRTVNYQLERTAKNVVVNVRILFVNQAETATGGREGAMTTIPAGDPRIAFGTDLCTKIVGPWNNKMALVPKPVPALAAGGAPPAAAPAPAPAVTPVTPPSTPPPAPAPPVKLPLVYKATPIFGAPGTAADYTIALYGQGTVAGGKHGIDDRHFYMNRGQYDAPLDAIYAHEYGHLLGLQDEYSRSSHQLHLLMHRASPGSSAATLKAGDDAFDKAVADRMVIQAMIPTVVAQVQALGPKMAAMFRSRQTLVQSKLTTGLRAAFHDPSVVESTRQAISAELQDPANAQLLKALPGIIRFELFDNLSNASIAGDIARLSTSSAGLSRIIEVILRRLVAAKFSTVTGTGGVKVGVEASTAATTRPGDAASSATLAGHAMGTTTGPAASPSAGFVDKVQGIADSFGGSAAALSDGLTPEKLRTLYGEVLPGNINAGHPGTARNAGQLYRLILNLTHDSVAIAGRRAMRQIFEASLEPFFSAKLDEILSMLQTDAAAHTTATPTGTDASATPTPPDPATLAAAKSVQASMQAMVAAQKTASSTASEEPASGSTQQAVSLSVKGLMGEGDKGNTVRPDMMAGTSTMEGVVTQFNKTSLLPGETPFEVKPL